MDLKKIETLLTTVYQIIDKPEQVESTNAYPGRHAQEYDPIVLTHVVSSGHVAKLYEHSSRSRYNEKDSMIVLQSLKA